MTSPITDDVLIAIASGKLCTADAISPDIDINSFGDQVPRTALMAAAFAGSSDLMSSLVARGAALDLGHADWGTGLHQAAGEGHVDAVRRLLDLGANIEAETAAGITPLMMAAAWGHSDVVSLLLDRGANVNHRNRAGLTPRMLAAEKEENDIAAMLEAAELAADNRASSAT
jgi:ankyrin repeat protein